MSIDDFGLSSLNRITPVISGLGLACGFGPPANLLYESAVRREQLATEIATTANVTIDEVLEFHLSSQYDLEFIKAAVQAGARLDKEDIRRTMEERVAYQFDRTLKYWSNLEDLIGKQNSTFVVILPNSDRREVKAAYMEVDGGSLYFEDSDHETILAFGPGHWVWAERLQEDEPAA